MFEAYCDDANMLNRIQAFLWFLQMVSSSLPCLATGCISYLFFHTLCMNRASILIWLIKKNDFLTSQITNILAHLFASL